METPTGGDSAKGALIKNRPDNQVKAPESQILKSEIANWTRLALHINSDFMNSSRTNFPSFEAFEEGSLRPLRKMSRYLSHGAAGEVRTLLQPWFDLLEGGELIFSRFFQPRLPRLQIEDPVQFAISDFGI